MSRTLYCKIVFSIVLMMFVMIMVKTGSVHVYAQDSKNVIPVYRLYNETNKEHLYTTSVYERNNCIAAGWKIEGTAWYACIPPAHGQVSSEMSEAELKSIAGSYGSVDIWGYADYDGNGTLEAFFVADSGKSTYFKVYYIDSAGKLTLMGSKWGCCYENENGNVRACQGKRFFFADHGAGGSGWLTVLYSVRDDVPYELDLSDGIQGFIQDGDLFYTTVNDFSKGYHTYPEYRLIYHPESQQFTRGERISE